LTGEGKIPLYFLLRENGKKSGEFPAFEFSYVSFQMPSLIVQYWHVDLIDDFSQAALFNLTRAIIAQTSIKDQHTICDFK